MVFYFVIHQRRLLFYSINFFFFLTLVSLISLSFLLVLTGQLVMILHGCMQIYEAQLVIIRRTIPKESNNFLLTGEENLLFILVCDIIVCRLIDPAKIWR